MEPEGTSNGWKTKARRPVVMSRPITTIATSSSRKDPRLCLGLAGFRAPVEPSSVAASAFFVSLRPTPHGDAPPRRER